MTPWWVWDALMILAISLIAVLATGCTTVTPTPTASIPVPVQVDCHYPAAGPKPDLSALAALNKASTPQQTLTVMGAALASLAEDDARLRALMAHGN
jgi:hypothetical protein